MSTTSPEKRREGALAGLAMAFSALVVVTCSATREAASPAQIDSIGAAPPGPGEPASAAPGAASSAPALASAPGAAPGDPGDPGDPGAAASAASAASGAAARRPGAVEGLGRFQGALDELKAGRRADHVRVVWLGDSHTAADIWTGAVRRALQAKYGDGGPGFVHAGWGTPHYRHEKVKVETQGKWRVEPGDYARHKAYDDGRLGLGGVRLVPREPGASTTISPNRSPEGGEFTWDLAYRLPEGAELSATVDDKELKPQRSPAGEVRHWVSKTHKNHQLKIQTRAGKPQLLGLTIEAKKPGVILDTVGLNGARVGTFLGREARAWVDELKRRKPDLVVLAFGTNESSALAPEASFHEKQMRELLGRVREAAPAADCLIITPADRAGAEYGPRLQAISQGFEAAARGVGCAVWSASEAMGGPGSMAAWAAESPPRGGSDGVHLTGKGYLSLGETLARHLIQSDRAEQGLPPGEKAP